MGARESRVESGGSRKYRSCASPSVPVRADAAAVAFGTWPRCTLRAVWAGTGPRAVVSLLGRESPTGTPASGRSPLRGAGDSPVVRLSKQGRRRKRRGKLPYLGRGAGGTRVLTSCP